MLKEPGETPAERNFRKMGKINKQTLKEASDRLCIAWGMLTHFNCRGMGCDGCPMKYEERCAAVILGEMYVRADKRAKEAANDNH